MPTCRSCIHFEKYGKDAFDCRCRLRDCFVMGDYDACPLYLSELEFYHKMEEEVSIKGKKK